MEGVWIVKVIEQFSELNEFGERVTGQRIVEMPDVMTETEGLAKDTSARLEATERARMAFLRNKIIEAVLGNDGVVAADRTEYRTLRAKYPS